MWRMRVCLILVGDKLLAAKGTLLCKTGPSPTAGVQSVRSASVSCTHETNCMQLFKMTAVIKVKFTTISGNECHWGAAASVVCYISLQHEVEVKRVTLQWTVTWHCSDADPARSRRFPVLSFRFILNPCRGSGLKIWWMKWANLFPSPVNIT